MANFIFVFVMQKFFYFVIFFQISKREIFMRKNENFSSVSIKIVIIFTIESFNKLFVEVFF